MHPRLTISGSMAVVLFAGVGLAAMRSGSDLWLRILYTHTVLALLVAAIAARYCGSSCPPAASCRRCPLRRAAADVGKAYVKAVGGMDSKAEGKFRHATSHIRSEAEERHPAQQQARHQGGHAPPAADRATIPLVKEMDIGRRNGRAWPVPHATSLAHGFRRPRSAPVGGQ
jgi:hypothetical protein